MNKISCFCFSILLIIMAGSCEKESKSNPDDLVEIGNYTGLRIDYHDVILVGGYHDRQEYEIDIDRDGVNDFQIMSNIWGSPGMGQYPEADIACLNRDSYFNVNHYSDTSFLHISIDTHHYESVEIYIRNTFTCERIDAADSILKVKESHYLNVFKKEDIISISDPWISDTLGLDYSWSSYYDIYDSSPDTIIYQVNTFDYNCHPFPGDEIRYIGIKKVSSELTRLGWIKLSISDNYKVSILETALQE